MRVIRIVVSIIFIIVLGAFVFFHFTKSTDNTVPHIKCDVPVIEASVKDTDADLLKHITAVDEKDGDISKNVIIEKSSAFVDFGKVIVTFAVCDNDNNVSKINVPVTYTDYSNPRFELTDDLVFRTGGAVNVEDCIKVKDSFDGDITDRLVVIANDADIEENGKYPLTLKITNSKSYTSTMNIDLIMSDKFTNGYSVELSDYLIYKKVGEKVDYKDMIKSVATPPNSMDNTKVTVDSSKVNKDEAGIYNVYYYQKLAGETMSMTRLVICYED
ncbi:MAG: hypothetical protein MJ147_03105 [Clostridia bacterium]|nr:hypothetical protein [Clostridia bacterium]